MNAIKWSILATALGFIVGFGLLGPWASSFDDNSETVRWRIDNTTVHATITRPQEDDGVHPGVLFIAGSGPTDRDWTSPLLKGDNGSGALLAQALADRGYVSLRYDKRLAGKGALLNVVKMAGKISMESHVDEVRTAIEQLAARDDVDPSRLYILTNSEGAIHAFNYLRSDSALSLAGLILTAPPGRTVQQLGETQVAFMLEGQEDSGRLLQAYRDAIDALLADEEMMIDPDLPDGAKLLLRSVSAPVNQPFARELLTADIAPWLADLEIPTLVLIGKKDIQVDWQLDGQPLETQAAGNPNITFAYPENANHVLKYESTPREELTSADGATYNLADRVLDPESVELIMTWLAERS